MFPLTIFKRAAPIPLPHTRVGTIRSSDTGDETSHTIESGYMPWSEKKGINNHLYDELITPTYHWIVVLIKSGNVNEGIRDTNMLDEVVRRCRQSDQTHLLTHNTLSQYRTCTIRERNIVGLESLEQETSPNNAEVVLELRSEVVEQKYRPIGREDRSEHIAIARLSAFCFIFCNILLAVFEIGEEFDFENGLEGEWRSLRREWTSGRRHGNEPSEPTPEEKKEKWLENLYRRSSQSTERIQSQPQRRRRSWSSDDAEAS
ncbi:hypothetical protein BLNAU_16579 [Blattamonas nauphoetae]|uniref:Uncharacterized protein n=1 Tax=Blattamonas nauphoetae TaxID=2049346 RepID=A0ABQ9XB96_9EUKA|nr:hypothetical protein BLNAU_16579 [Blattamonas nauphoetae]